MNIHRRRFFATLPSTILVLTTGREILADATPQQRFPPAPPQEPEPPFRPDPRALLKENQKDLKREVERLFELAEQLKKEVERTDSTDVLSVSLVRKAEEIEKLARSIKKRARG